MVAAGALQDCLSFYVVSFPILLVESVKLFLQQQGCLRNPTSGVVEPFSPGSEVFQSIGGALTLLSIFFCSFPEYFNP